MTENEAPLSRKEVIARMHTSPVTLTKWEREFGFPRHDIGRHPRYFWSEIASWLSKMPNRLSSRKRRKRKEQTSEDN